MRLLAVDKPRLACVMSTDLPQNMVRSMRMRSMMVAAAFALVGGLSPVSADETAAPSATPSVTPAPVAPAPAKPSDDEERMICRAERTIGSNRMTRVCRTAAQIEREREAARSQMGKTQICSTCGGG